MLAAEDCAYRSLQEHLAKMPVGFPVTESGGEINLRKATLAPQQAKIANTWIMDTRRLIRFSKPQ